jgi:hypothetical protein
MQYLAEPSKVVYRAKDGTGEKVFDALKWRDAMRSHIRRLYPRTARIPTKKPSNKHKFL